MTENELLRKICDLVIGADPEPYRSSLQWISHLLTLHRRHWLYCSFLGQELIAVAGAYRIPEWNEQFRYELPEKAEGDTLYIPFFVSKEAVSIAPLRLLKFCLRENPQVREIVYSRKKWSTGSEVFKVWRRNKAVDLV